MSLVLMVGDPGFTSGVERDDSPSVACRFRSAAALSLCVCCAQIGAVMMREITIQRCTKNLGAIFMPLARLVNFITPVSGNAIALLNSEYALDRHHFRGAFAGGNGRRSQAPSLSPGVCPRDLRQARLGGRRSASRSCPRAQES